MASRTTSLLLAVTHSKTQYIVAARPGHIRCLVRSDVTASLVTAVTIPILGKDFPSCGRRRDIDNAEEEIRRPTQAIQ